MAVLLAWAVLAWAVLLAWPAAVMRARRPEPRVLPVSGAVGGSSRARDPREVLTRAAPPPDAVLRYGDGPDQVADLRLPGGVGAVPGAGVGVGGGAGPGVRAGRSVGGGTGEGVGRRGDAGGGVSADSNVGAGSRVAGLGVDAGLEMDAGRGAPIVVFLHGGFWRTEFDRAHTGPLSAALAAAGYAVCVPEFRRTSGRRRGWPATLDDVAAAVDALPAMVAAAAGTCSVDPTCVVLGGHSAGGHLALWAAGRHRLPAGAPWRTEGPRSVRGVVALAAVSDLTACHRQGLGDDAATALMGGSPDDVPSRYEVADPARLLPLGVPLWLVHGGEDDIVPPSMSRAFTTRARAAGDEVVLRELTACEHFGLIDPLSPAWPQVLSAFAAAAGA
jgi:acetyl esterase/lipase